MPCAAAISSGGTAAARVVAVKHRKKKEAEEGEVEVKRTKVGRGCAWINRQKLPYSLPDVTSSNTRFTCEDDPSPASCSRCANGEPEYTADEAGYDDHGAWCREYMSSQEVQHWQHRQVGRG